MSLLNGVRVLVTAGPTYEDIDPVRFLGNRSSGKMGFAIARQAQLFGAEVMLVAGPVHLETPHGVSRVDVRSAAQMHQAVMNALPADFYVGAAAVADFTPEQYTPLKIKKQADDEGLTIKLGRTVDILREVANAADRPALVCGFAAETHDIEVHAQGKLNRKNLDLIAVNRIGIEGSGFESDRNLIHVFTRGSNGMKTFGPSSKDNVAKSLLEYMALMRALQI